MFYCRETELKKMNQRYESDGFECVIVYGRRRVGKTSLIRRFCESKPMIYFSALLEETAKENLKTLSRAIGEYKTGDAQSAPEYQSFDDAFAEITRLAAKEKLIFVIDEYPYLAKAAPTISSHLQHLIDHAWSETNLYLILCGSSMSFMENQVLGYQSPLYGRRTAQFKIEPLTYRETAVFNPDLTPEENAYVYGVTGGIPHYINKLDVRGDLNRALLDNLFDPSAYLFEEPSNLLKQELREPAIYNAIITAIAEGHTRMSEIASKVGMESSACSKYISVLLNLGILRKVTPVTEKPGRKTVYKISDPFFRFWYRFVPQNITAIASGRMDRIFDKAVTLRLSDYMGLIFEQMCREYLLFYDNALDVQIADIGEWWGTDEKEKKQIQIDIVGTTPKKNEFLIGSCKFRNEKVGYDELELMRHYAKVFARNGKFRYVIFSKTGFADSFLEAEKKGEVRLITLSDMYRENEEKGAQL